MEARNFVKCLFGGITLGGATTFMASVTNDGFCNGRCVGSSDHIKPYYSGLFEEDDAGRVCQKQSGNMPPSYVSDTNIKMEKPPSLREYE
jgi:hypothetical protein